VNDRGSDVATLFRVLQRHLAAFLDLIRYQLTSRAEFASRRIRSR
jgi:DNA adenine methylase